VRSPQSSNHLRHAFARELRQLRRRRDTRKALVESLTHQGCGPAHLAVVRGLIDAESSDLLDVLADIAFALPPITRAGRVQTRKPSIHSPYDEKLQAALDFVLAQYVSEGSDALAEAELPALPHPRYRTMSESMTQPGGIRGPGVIALGGHSPRGVQAPGE
jgi:type I restriction enzyme R subunit